MFLDSNYNNKDWHNITTAAPSHSQMQDEYK